MKGEKRMLRLIVVMLSLGLFYFAGNVQGADPVRVQFKTTAGEIVLELDAEKAPITVENFLGHVKSGHYEGTIFHRVMKDFMIQCGGFDQRGVEKKAGKQIQNEAANGLSNVKYSVAMARTRDPNSATTQFFINTDENGAKGLDRSSPVGDGFGYCVFGKVIEGHKVVDAIAAAQVGPDERGEPSKPVKPVVIEKAQVVAPAR